MILEKSIAKINSVTTVLDENFHQPIRNWQRVEDEDERSFITGGLYHMENFTNSRWMYYHVDSGLHMPADNFLITTEMRAVRGGDFSGFGLVFGFEKHASNLNRYVISQLPARVVAAAFRREDSHSFERFTARIQPKSGADTHSFDKLIVLRLFNKVYFFLNDASTPVMEVAASAFMWTGNRIGFYTEPGMHIQAKSLTVKKIDAVAQERGNFEQLLTHSECTSCNRKTSVGK